MIRFDENLDQLILVGDVINKGPNSFAMIEWLFKHPTVITLMGNHENAFLKFLKGSFENPLFEDLKRKLSSDISHVKDWINELPLYYRDSQKIVVHAGLEPKKAIEKQSQRILTTIRTWDGKGKDLKSSEHYAWYHYYRLKTPIFFGHWAANGLVRERNITGLDTGCVYGGKLSAVILPENKLVQVSAKKVYKQICY